MSGIVGMVHFDDRPVDRRLLETLTASMAYRGPDGQKTWAEGAVGLGQAKFATTAEARREQQPLHLNEEVWIVADARIDGREELKSTLEDAGRERVQEATDAELILHAYMAWGSDVAAHLLGDFSFAIWDRPRRRLLCARDHFGVKPFYYTQWPGGIAFSNTLSCLRRHPKVTSALDGRAVSDFLLFETNLDPEATTFSDIRRLPPAHVVSFSSGQRNMSRYWDLPTDNNVSKVPEEGWVERFRSLFNAAVEDRLRSDKVAVMMSGGLDSTSVAASAQGILKSQPQNPKVHCFTCGYERLIPDREVRYARLAATTLAAPLSYHPVDHYQLAERWGELPIPPEPSSHLLDAFGYDFDRSIAKEARVLLTGFGGDSLLLPSRDYFLGQLRAGRLDRSAAYVATSLWRTNRLPPLGLTTRWHRWRRQKSWRHGYPSWLDPDLEARFDLEGRWRWRQLERGPETVHSQRPEAYRDFWEIAWTNSFENQDAGARTSTVEQRHPLFDLRLVEFSLSVPPVPWCLKKRLLRDAMKGILPDAIRLRPKAPVAQPAAHSLVRPASLLWKELRHAASGIEQFVRPKQVLDELRRREAGSATALYRDPIYRPLNLAYWLANAREL